MAVAVRAITSIADADDVAGPFAAGQSLAIDSGGVWRPITPLTIPLHAITSGNVNPSIWIDHSITDASFPSPTGTAPDYAPRLLTVNYQASSSNISSPFDLTCIGDTVRVTYGSPSVDGRGTVQARTSLFDVQGSGSASNEFAADMGWMRFGTSTKAPVGRAWYTDYTLHGPIGAQNTLLNGVTMCLQKYHSSVPTAGPACAYIAVTRPGAGAGSEVGHALAQTYANEAAFAGVGFSGVPSGTRTRGWHAAFQAGGYASGWMPNTDTSIIGRGLDVTDCEEAGVKLWGPLSAAGFNPKGIWFADDSPSRTWDWLLYADDSAGHMHAPTSGAFLLPGANGTAGQIKWGVDGLAPSMFRQANSTLQISGKVRVVQAGGGDPLLYVTGTAASDPVSIVAETGGGIAKLAVAGTTGNFLTGSAAGDTLLLFKAGKNLRIGDDANTSYAILTSAGAWGFGTTAPTVGFHAALGGRFSGNLPGTITATDAGVYLGMDTTPKVVLITGTSGNRKWQIENVAGVFGLSEPGTAHLTLSNTTLSLLSKLLVQTGAGTNSFAGNLQVDGSTRLAVSLTGLLKATAGAVTVGVAGTDYEAPLGNPGTSGFVLASTTGGARSWVALPVTSDPAASYVTMAAEANLSNETVLGAGVIMAGIASARPTPTVAGPVYLATDTGGGTSYRYGGAAWVQMGASVLHAAAHLPGGADALTTATAVGLSNSSTAGSGAAFSLANHTHKRDVNVALAGTVIGTRNKINFTTNAGSVTVTDDSGNDQVTINIPPPGATTASDTVLGLADTNTAGTGTNFSRNDHQHKRTLNVASAGSVIGTRGKINFTTTAGLVTVTDDAGNDQVTINIPPPAANTVEATVATLTSAAGTAGVLTTYSAGDHRHTIGAAAVTNAMLVNPSATITAGTGLAGGGSLVLGAAVTLSLAAHVATHQPGGTDPLVTAAPVSVGTANAAGSGTALALATHVHRNALAISIGGSPIAGTARTIFNLVAGAGITIVGVDNSPGSDQVTATIASTITAGADPAASYVTMSAEAGLSNETVLATGVHMSSILSSRPTPAVAGPFHFTTDTNGGTLYRWSGAAWVQIAPGVTQAPQAHQASHLPGGTDALTLGSPVTLDGTAADGTAASFPRSDHKHAITFGAPVALDGAAATGAAASTANSAHKHADVNRPTDNEKAAFLGTNGTPSNTNRFVTNSDPRLVAANESTASLTWDPPSVGNLSGFVADFTVTGAAVGDAITHAFSTILPDGMFLFFQAVGANTVRGSIFNMSGAAQDVASGTLRLICRH